MSNQWQRTGISRDIFKDFFYMYGCTYRGVKFSEGEMQLVDLEKIIPLNQDWDDTIWRYNGLMKRIEKGKGAYVDSAWWKHEIQNQTKNIQKRMDKFEDLYYSIKNKGFKYLKRRHIKLVDISRLRRKNPLKGGRINWKYYRANGMKRILICNFLGIKKIPCKVYHVEINK